MKVQLWSDKLYMCFLVVRLASPIPLTAQSGTNLPPLLFPADEDISSCHFTPTIRSPTQPWHGASLYPTDEDSDDNAGGASLLANHSLSLPSLAPAPVAVVSKRDNHNNNQTGSNPLPAIRTTIAAFTFTDLSIRPPLANRRTKPPLDLDPGRYVLSFTNNKRLHLVGVETAAPGQRSTLVLHNVDNGWYDTEGFSLTEKSEVAFFSVERCRGRLRLRIGRRVGRWRCFGLGQGEEGGNGGMDVVVRLLFRRLGPNLEELLALTSLRETASRSSQRSNH